MNCPPTGRENCTLRNPDQRTAVDLRLLHPPTGPGKPLPRGRFGTSGHRGSSSITASMKRISWRSARRSPNSANRKTSPARCTWEWIPTPCPSRRCIRRSRCLPPTGWKDRPAGLGYTPTPVISHAILAYNHGRTTGLADGVVITPSHNPPEDGGFKYNPPSRRTGRHQDHPMDPGPRQ